MLHNFAAEPCVHSGMPWLDRLASLCISAVHLRSTQHCETPKVSTGPAHTLLPGFSILSRCLERFVEGKGKPLPYNYLASKSRVDMAEAFAIFGVVAGAIGTS